MWVTYHDGVDTSELSEENHDVGVDNSTAGARLGDEVHPWKAVCATSSDLCLFLFGANLHDEEFLASFVSRNTANTAPDLVCLERLALVHKESWRLRHKEHTDTHDCGENEGTSEDVTPATVDSNEHSSYGVSENFTERNVKLIERYQVAAKSRLDGLGDVDGNCATFETDTGTEDDAGCDNHAIVDGTGFKGTTDGVEDTGDEDCPTTTEVFIAWRNEESTSDSCNQLAYARVDARM
jgi:hypothetical protein